MTKVRVNRVQANIVEWFDNKGYGFARLSGGTQRIFVHAKSLGKGLSRLKKGDKLELEVITGRTGRPAAKDVKLLNKKTLDKKIPYHLYTAAILLLLVQLLFILNKAPLALLAIYAIMSLISISLYRHDKKAAQYGWPRIREYQLLAVDLFGGIIGSLIAQVKYRHKTSKPNFQKTIFFIVVIHSVFLASLGAGLI